MKNINKIFDCICNTLLALGLGVSFTHHGDSEFHYHLKEWLIGLQVWDIKILNW